MDLRYITPLTVTWTGTGSVRNAHFYAHSEKGWADQGYDGS